ncbi:myosin heavy chain [Anaeramoeba flamelloides]|uniref:Myosin heavy chain n=1 Tax=Anaeramoeba flamelloides TaxID=1746091 RepID=A0ABQ8ZEF2_9EUKA|nr:myosin heavy chain [Anaeramoeba flamelloides]
MNDFIQELHDLENELQEAAEYGQKLLTTKKELTSQRNDLETILLDLKQKIKEEKKTFKEECKLYKTNKNVILQKLQKSEQTKEILKKENQILHDQIVDLESNKQSSLESKKEIEVLKGQTELLKMQLSERNNKFLKRNEKYEKTKKKLEEKRMRKEKIQKKIESQRQYLEQLGNEQTKAAQGYEENQKGILDLNMQKIENYKMFEKQLQEQKDTYYQTKTGRIEKAKQVYQNQLVILEKYSQAFLDELNRLKKLRRQSRNGKLPPQDNKKECEGKENQKKKEQVIKGNLFDEIQQKYTEQSRHLPGKGSTTFEKQKNSKKAQARKNKQDFKKLAQIQTDFWNEINQDVFDTINKNNLFYKKFQIGDLKETKSLDFWEEMAGIFPSSSSDSENNSKSDPGAGTETYTSTGSGTDTNLNYYFEYSFSSDSELSSSDNDSENSKKKKNMVSNLKELPMDAIYFWLMIRCKSTQYQLNHNFKFKISGEIGTKVMQEWYDAVLMNMEFHRWGSWVVKKVEDHYTPNVDKPFLDKAQKNISKTKSSPSLLQKRNSKRFF